MTTPSPEHGTDREALAWRAFQYVARELGADDEAAFELRLADDEAAQEEVAKAVELWRTVDAACTGGAAAESIPEKLSLVSVAAAANGAGEGNGWRTALERLAWMAGGVAACLAAVYATAAPVANPARTNPTGELAQADPHPTSAPHPTAARPNPAPPLPVLHLPQGWAAELAVLPREGVEGSAGLHAADDAADSDAWLASRWESEESDSGEHLPTVPGWLIQALSAEEGAVPTRGEGAAAKDELDDDLPLEIGE